ncbi:MAG: oligosaccharide flippase family protein [Bacteroidales bacterium]|nr:oligosaccharide flippase family protein [Bacteroidales bacterium]MDD4002378.1 oligosaccharide flippase family protein [Bacteroidales bacterium]
MGFTQKFVNKYIKGNEMFYRFINVFSVDVFVRGANLLLIPVFLYLMTRREFGIYNYLYSFAMTASGILNFGFYVSLSKLYADTIENKKKQSSMIFTVTTSLLVLLSISIIILYFTKTDISFFNYSMKNNLDEINTSIYLNYRTYVFIAIISMIFTNYLTFFFISSENIPKLQKFNIFRLILSNGTAILVLYFSSSETVMLRLAITYVAELLLTIVFGSFIVKRFIPVFDFYYLKKAFKIGTPIMIAAIMATMVNFGDKFFVMKYAGVNDFADYSLAIMLATIILIVFQSFNFVWLPLFLKEKDMATLKRKTKRYTIFMFLALFGIGFIIFLVVWVALKFKIIPSTYSGGILLVLPILIFSQIFAALIGLYVNFMTYFEKTYIQVFVGGVISFIGYFLFDYLTSAYLGVGAALALLILNILSFIFYYTRTQYYISNRLIHNKA